MTHRTKTAMPSPAATIAIAALGPSGQPLLAHLRAHTPPGVQVLPSDIAPPGRLGPQVGLLIVVVHQASEQDSQAVQATAQRVQDHGFGLPTLCVALQPPLGTSGKQKTLAHYAWQMLQAQTDAHVLLPCDADMPLADWLAQAVRDMAQSLGHGASIGIDMKDLTRLLRGAGAAAWVSAQASGPEKAHHATQQLLADPLLGGVHLQSARQAAVWITAAPQAFKLRELRNIGQTLQQHIHPNATQLYSVVHDEHLGDTLRLSALFTGITRCAA